MAFEKAVITNIINKFEQSGNVAPSVWFEYGTLWADTNSQLDAYTIRQAVEECLSPNYTVKISKLDSTDVEPWDQYAFDIVPKPFYENNTVELKVVA